MLPRILLFILFPALLSADPVLRSSPALKLTFDTKQGALHQLQVKGDKGWKDIGPAIRGTGKPWSTFQPEGEYRLHSPTEETAPVWSDDFHGIQINFTKWDKE